MKDNGSKVFMDFVYFLKKVCLYYIYAHIIYGLKINIKNVLSIRKINIYSIIYLNIPSTHTYIYNDIY